MYGRNDPKGLIPKFPNNGSQPNQALSSVNGPNAYIQSGYAQNIGIGDPVILSNGYVINAADADSGWAPGTDTRIVRNTPIYGVFQGCYFDNDDNTVLNPLQPVQQAWKAGTVTQDGNPALAYILPCTYNLLYSVQVGATAAQFGIIGRCGTLTFPVNSTTGVVTLNNDQSTAYLDVGAGTGSAYNPGAGTPYSSFYVVGFDNQANIIRTVQSQVGLPYGNVLVHLGNQALPTYTSV